MHPLRIVFMNYYGANVYKCDNTQWKAYFSGSDSSSSSSSSKQSSYSLRLRARAREHVRASKEKDNLAKIGTMHASEMIYLPGTEESHQ